MTSSRVLLVTGAGSGIGAAVAERAAGEGWQVVVCGRRREPLGSVAERTGALPIVADLTDAAAIDGLVAATLASFGRLDCVVANAGVMTPGASSRSRRPTGTSPCRRTSPRSTCWLVPHSPRFVPRAARSSRSARSPPCARRRPQPLTPSARLAW